MSLCRWSSDNWKCDLYCYYDCRDGITIHVSEQKIVGDIPKVPNIQAVSSREFVKAHKKQMDFLDSAKREPIGLSEDGETFNVNSIKEFHEKLIYLRNLGYNFPDYLFEINEEP